MLEDKIEKVLSILNERQKRLYLAMEAEEIGHGGVLIASKASNVSGKTIIKGKKELHEFKKKDRTGIADEIIAIDRIRKEGGGRKDITEKNPELMNKLELMLEPVTRGHPESVLKWTCLSTRTLALALKKQGYAVSHTKVSELLKEAGFSLQSNAKRLEGTDHPDRNEQFMYINNKTEKYIANDYRAISVDTKKKELIGTFKNSGKEYRPPQRSKASERS